MTGKSAGVSKNSFYEQNTSTPPSQETNKSKMITIKAKVSRYKISYLLDTFICSEVKPNSDGSITAAFTVPDEEWLTDLLLGFGPDMKIISPKSVREKIITLAGEVIKQYK